MADVNKIIVIGRLTRDPQLKYLPNQTALCEGGIAMGRKYKTASGEQREESTFLDFTVFGKGGEIFNQYMTKGKQVYLEGRLKFDSWEDKNGGGKRSKLSMVVDDFQFLGSPGEGGQQAPNDNGDQRPQREMGKRPPAKQGEPQAPYGEEQAFNDDDIPF